MSFSKDDRKDVFDYFVHILLKFNKPVYYELLRGHISNAKPKVREFARKHCKGEELLKYFQKRKNYFDVDFRNEVSLKKDRCMSLPKRTSESSEMYESDYLDNSDSECTDYSRSSSVSASWTNDYDKNYSSKSVSSSSMGKDDLEAVAIVHFRDLLGIAKKRIKTLDLEGCPPAVQLYVTKYLKKNIALLFRNNPDVFRVENDEVRLVNSPEKEDEFWETEDNQEPIKTCKSPSEEEAEDIQNFIQCAEFFVTLLKKKRSVSLSHLSGSLSKAPSSVSDYLKSNYSSYKDFILESKGLFNCSEIGGVSLTEDCFKLLKRGKKLSHFKSETVFCSSTVQKQVNEIFGLEPAISTIVKPELEERKSHSDFNKSGSPNSHVSSEDVFYSAEDDIFDNKSIKDIQTADEEAVRSKRVDEVQEDLKSDIENKQDLVADKPNLPDEEVENSCTNSRRAADKVTLESVIELAFCLQFLALERVDIEYIFRLNNEYDAVKFFVEILEKNFFPRKNADLNSLKGFLGQAPPNVKNFMKQLYKGIKISDFFEEYEEFDTRSNFSFIGLSLSYKTYLEEKKNLHNDYIKGKKVYAVHNLFNAHLSEVMIDALDCVSKICSFIQNRSKVRLSRLQSIFPQLSASQKEFIHSFDGCEFTNKLQEFLSCFTIFYVADDCVGINPELNIQLLVGSINKFCEQLKSLKDEGELKSTFDFLLNLTSELEVEEAGLDFDCFKTEVIEILKNLFSETESFGYSFLPKIVGTEILYSLLSENSKSLIQFLEDSTLFELKNGQIFLKKDCEVAEIFHENDLNETKPLDQVDSGKNDDIVENFNDADLNEIKPLDQIDSGKNDDIVENFNDALDTTVDLYIDSFSKGSLKCEHLSTPFNKNGDIEAKENETINLNSTNTVESSTTGGKNEIVSDIIVSDKAEDGRSVIHELGMLDREINSNTSEDSSALNALDVENVSTDDLNENTKFTREEIDLVEESLEKLIDADIGKIRASAGFYEEYNRAVSLDKGTAKLDYDIEMFEKLFNKQSDEKIYNLKLFFQSFKEKLDLETKKSCTRISENGSDDNLETKDTGDVEIQNECKSNETNASENNHPESFLENNVSELKRKKNYVSSDEMEDITNTEISEIISSNKENVDKLKAKSPLLSNKQNEHQTAISEKCLEKGAKHRTYSISSTDNEVYINNGFVNEIEISNVLSEITTSVKVNKNDYEVLKPDFWEDTFVKESSKYNIYSNDSSSKVLDKSIDSTKVKLKPPDKNKCSNKEKLSDSSSKSGISYKDQSKNSFGNFEKNTGDDLSGELSVKNNECGCSTSSKSSSDLSENDQDLSESSEQENGKGKKLKNPSQIKNSPLFLQPLQARIILLTLDSCVVETVIEDCKRYVFCLKSTFHCDQHNNCTEDFDSLTVGDEVSCFVPPGEDFSSGNMCFAIMFCRDSKQAEIPFVHPSKNAQRKLELVAAIKEQSVSPPAHEPLNNPNSNSSPSRVSEVQTDLIGEVKPFRHGVEKACGIQCLLISQDSQTTCESREVDSQTVLSGSIKSALPVADKTCLVKPDAYSKSVQAISDSVDSDCQTIVTGNIKPQFRSSSSECQTVLSGQIQKSVHLVDNYCEALPHFDLVSEETQTIVEFDDACENQNPDAFAVTTTLPCNYVCNAADFKDVCDNACQTIATGPIMIKKYYL